MKNMTYNEFIDDINDPNKIKQIDFYIDGYKYDCNYEIRKMAKKLSTR